MADNGQNVTIDNLDIEISASLDKANESIDKLCANLSKLSTALGKAGLKTTGLRKVKEEAQKTQPAIEKVSNALKGLGSALNAIHGASQKLDGFIHKVTQKISNFKNHTDRAEKSTSKFASTVGMLYARFWLLKRALEKVWGNVKSAMGYIETLNYFNKAFKQVATESISSWADAGYESAEAYADSFQKRASQLTTKLTGFAIDSTGALQSTGKISLGLNPTDTMNYQAMFGQMASSMGVASENALVLSNVLTELGADLASVKNLDFNDVWKDMASGLVGMSRTLDKYGANIRNVNLQNKLNELGIDAMVSKLNQQDKALLRTIILLDSTRYAWGDLSQTLSQPANQIRMLTNNLKMLGQMIGSLFLPIVAKILPYVNALVIALQRLVTAIMNVFGITAKLGDITKDVGQDNSMISDLLDESEDLTDELDDSADKAKKLKNNLQGIDELNIISKDTSDSLADISAPDYSDLLNDAFWDAVSEYQSAWDKAFENVSNKANEIADRIVEAFKVFAEPIKIAWDTKGDFVIDAWKKAISSVGDMIKDIAKDMSTVWHQPETVKIFEDIFEIVGNIGLVVGNLADQFRLAWNESKTGLHILENIRNIVGAIVKGFKDASEYTVIWAKNLDFRPILKAVEELTRNIAERMGSIVGVFTDFYEIVVLGVIKYATEVALPNLVKAFDNFVKKVDWDKLRANLAKVSEALSLIIERLLDAVVVLIDRFLTAVADFVNSPFFQKMIDMFNNWAKSLTGEQVADFIERIAKAFLMFKGIGFVSGLIAPLASLVATLLKYKQLADVTKAIETASVQKTLIGGVSGGSTMLSSLTTSLAGIGITIAGLGASVKSFSKMLVEGFSLADASATTLGTTIAGVGVAILTGLNPLVAGAIGALLGIVVSAGVLIRDHFDEIKAVCVAGVENIKTSLGNVVDIIVRSVSGAFNNILTPIKSAWDKVTSYLSNTFSKIEQNTRNAWDKIKSVFPTVWDGIAEKASEVWNGISNFLQNVWGNIKDFASKTWDSIKQNATEVWDNIKSSVIPKVEDIKNTIESKWDALKNNMGRIIDDIKNVASQRWEEVRTTIADKIQNLTDTIASKWEEVRSTISDKIVAIKETASQRWDEMKASTEQAIGSITEVAKKKWEEVKNGIKEKTDAIKQSFERFAEDFKKTRDGWLNQIPTEAKNKFEEVRKNISDKYNEIKGNASEFFKDFPNKLQSGASSAIDAFGKAFDKLPDRAKGALDGLKNAVSTVFSGISSMASSLWDGLKSLASNVSSTLSGLSTKIGIKGFATGGFPEAGQLFLARESGAEMVGSLNGKTAVANNDQIVAGIASGVYKAVSQAYAERNDESLLQELIVAVKQGSSITIDGRELVSAYDSRKARNGFAF